MQIEKVLNPDNFYRKIPTLFPKNRGCHLNDLPKSFREIIKPNNSNHKKCFLEGLLLETFHIPLKNPQLHLSSRSCIVLEFVFNFRKMCY